MSYEEERIKLENANVAVKEKKLVARQQKKIVHKEFAKKHKILLLVMDILVVCMVLANFGVVMMTNALVVKEKPDVQIMEANVVQAEVNDYEQHPEGNNFMFALMFQTVMWAVILTGYLHTRLTIYTNKELWFAILIMMFYGYIIFLDFFNDLGYLLGKIIWGG